MKFVYTLFILLFVSEFIALFSKFSAAVFYSIWLFAVLLLLVYKKFEEKDFIIIFLTLPLVRLVQFLAPMQMIAYGYQLLVIYGLLLIVSIIYIRGMNINIRELYNLNKLSELVLIVPLIILAIIIGVFSKEQMAMQFSLLTFAIVLFCTYVQVLFIFGILQNKLEEIEKQDAVFLIPLIVSFLFISSLDMFLPILIAMFAFSYIFDKTKNLNLILAGMLILNIYQSLVF